jgi:hypothetical protein
MRLLSNWKLCLFALVFSFALSGCGDSPDDIYKKMKEAKNEAEIQKLSVEFNNSAEVNNSNYKSCKSSCSGSATSITVSDLYVKSKGKFPINGKVYNKNGRYQGSDMYLSNIKYDYQTKSLTLSLGENVKKFSKEELKVTKFDVSGFFVENHMMNHDVKGIVTSFKIDTKKMDEIKKANLEKEKKEASKLKMTLAQYRDYKSKIKFCKKDWKMCVDNAMLINNFSGMSKVKAACKVKANSRAKYGSPDWSWVSFGTYYVGDRYVKSGLVEVVDNTVKFQNGFGAMKKSKVSCVFDLKSDRVTALSIR